MDRCPSITFTDKDYYYPYKMAIRELHTCICILSMFATYRLDDPTMHFCFYRLLDARGVVRREWCLYRKQLRTREERRTEASRLKRYFGECDRALRQAFVVVKNDRPLLERWHASDAENRHR